MYINVNNAIIVTLCCFSLLLLYCIHYLRFLTKDKEKRLRLEQFTITTTIDAEATVINSLDTIINKTLAEYTYANIDCNPNFKFTPNIDSELTTLISNRVIDEISMVMFDKLSLVYQKDKIPEIIANRVYLQVVPYLIDKKSELE